MRGRKAIDMTGERYGHLEVLRLHKREHNRISYWLCRCDCGAERSVLRHHLVTGKTQSCGCLRKARATKHGGYYSSTYNSYYAMKRRCNNVRSQHYRNYGGRGVTVDPSWSTFQQFLADMGHRPPGTTLDRIDPNGNYCKENCRWADAITQANNKRQRA